MQNCGQSCKQLVDEGCPNDSRKSVILIITFASEQDEILLHIKMNGNLPLVQHKGKSCQYFTMRICLDEAQIRKIKWTSLDLWSML